VEGFQPTRHRREIREQTKQIGKCGAWILLTGLLALTVWKCKEGYKEYRSVSSAIDSLAAACKTSADQPCFTTWATRYATHMAPKFYPAVLCRRWASRSSRSAKATWRAGSTWLAGFISEWLNKPVAWFASSTVISVTL
jgi:hypothetical protein